ncbi:MAG: T9SS C-terminal target domain-containing protein [Calditrichaeota bacterium]|nr:MAG: T9SS C-terminal target domain-containing protein [Calditrichota bacterium]
MQSKSLPMDVRQNKFDVTYYKLNLNIDLEQISGWVEILARSSMPQLDSLWLDLEANMQVDSVYGDAKYFIHSKDRLIIPLKKSFQHGEIIHLTIAYHGQPQSAGFGSFNFDYHAGNPIIWTLSEPYFARTWWPCKDVPNDKADSVDVIVTVPEDLIAASNGTLISDVRHGNGTRTFHWHESYPITTYLVSLAITNYAIFSDWFRYSEQDSMEIRYYVYPENLSDAQSKLHRTVKMLNYFNQIFAPYPFLSEKYGIAQFPWPGGMEHQTITSQGGFGEVLTVHELAHQWWGDKITNANWHEIWLNEGFASYAEALYFEHIRGQEFYHTYMSWMDWDFPYPIYVDDTTSVSRIFHGTVYDKGAWFLHMLRHVVGDSTFFKILLAYSQDSRFAYANATTAGFQDVCENVSGMDLDWFFQPWIYEVGRPVYRASWWVDDSTGNIILNLKIEQMQYPQQALFPMPVDVTIQTLTGDTTVTVFNDAAVQVFKITLNELPTNIILDKDGWILKKIESITSVQTQTRESFTFKLFQNHPNPFNAETAITFSLAKKDFIVIKIYNLKGQRVRTLTEQFYSAGKHRILWDGTDDKGLPVASGVYVYQISNQHIALQRKLLLMR